jgi:hypothetical protein
MLELLFLFRLCRLIGVSARARGQTAIVYQILLVFLWFMFEIMGFIGAFLLLAVMVGPEADPEERSLFMPYLLGLVCAGIGAFLAFLVMLASPSRNETVVDLPEEETRRPRRLPRAPDDPQGIQEGDSWPGSSQVSAP